MKKEKIFSQKKEFLGNKKAGEDRERMTISKRLKGERAGDFPSRPTRWSPRKTTAWFLAYFFVVAAVLTAFFPFFNIRYYIMGIGAAGTVSLVTGLLLIASVFYCKHHYGALVEFGVSTAIRTGIPLVAGLAFYLAFDKILLYYSVYLLAVFYAVLFPMEVWVFLPQGESRANAEIINEEPQKDDDESERAPNSVFDSSGK